MKEIKVRFWDDETETIIYSDNCPDDYSVGFDQGRVACWRIEHVPATLDSPADTNGVLLETPAMMLTGLKDENYNEIYEGDIRQNGSVVVWSDKIGYDGGGGLHSGFYFHTKRDENDNILNLSYHEDLAECEIIGNIYENPELLK